ncbi:hypothetical protein D3C73_796220 [compost metagenome]
MYWCSITCGFAEWIIGQLPVGMCGADLHLHVIIARRIIPEHAGRFAGSNRILHRILNIQHVLGNKPFVCPALHGFQLFFLLIGAPVGVHCSW